jgi:hypothetical protein
MMKRILLILTAAALMVVLMAMTASYAFASHGSGENCPSKAWWKTEPGDHGCQKWGSGARR